MLSCLLVTKMKRSSNISEKDIEFARVCAAQIVSRFGDVYLPIFERLSRELDFLQSRKHAKNLALSIANAHL